MAWNLSTETAWHRCATDPTVALTSPPEGRYTLEAQDETQLCSESDTSAPGRNVTWRRSTLVVDGTPPAIAPPVVNAPAAVVASSRPIVHIDAAITDTLSGVATTVWNAGDGSPPAPVLGRRVGGFRHQYGIGTTVGSVTATDNAGNTATGRETLATHASPEQRPDPPAGAGAAGDRSHAAPPPPSARAGEPRRRRRGG